MSDHIDIRNINKFGTDNSAANKISKLLCRINRIQFISLSSISMFALIAGMCLFENANDIAAFMMIGLFVIVLFLLKAKRLHDINLVGWMALLTVVPIIGQILFLLILLAPGTDGDNKYGAKPGKAGLGHKSALSLILFTVITYIVGNYLGLWVKFEKWNEFHNKYYSIQLPGPYSVKNDEIFGISTEGISLNQTHIIFNVGRLDFKNITERDKKNFIRSVGLVSSLEDIFSINADNLIDILLPELKPDRFEVISDKINKNSSLSNRQIKAKLYINDAEAYIQLSAYLDNKLNQLYIIYAVYDHESKFYGDRNIIDYYFNSFKLAH